MAAQGGIISAAMELIKEKETVTKVKEPEEDKEKEESTPSAPAPAPTDDKKDEKNIADMGIIGLAQGAK